MTTLKGHPDVPAGTALNVRLIWDVPLQGAGRGLSPKHRDATYDWSTGKYMDGQAELTFPHPRAGQNDNALRGPLVAVYTIGTGPLSQTARYPLQAYETAPGELDITVDPNPATVVAAQTLIDLITGADVARTQAEEAAQRVNDAILDLSAERQAVADIIADTAQQQATNNANSAAFQGAAPIASVAALPATPGHYYVTDGPEATQRWQRMADGTATRRRDLEAVPKSVLPRVYARGFGVDAINSDNASALTLAVEFACAQGGGVVELPPGLLPVNVKIPVPNGVHIVGSQLGQTRQRGNQGGTVLLARSTTQSVFEFAPDPSDPTGRHGNNTISGLAIMYPDQYYGKSNPDATRNETGTVDPAKIITYPAAISGPAGTTALLRGVVVRDLNIIGGTTLADLSMYGDTNPHENIVFENITGFTYGTGIRWGRSSDVSYADAIHFNPNQVLGGSSRELLDYIAQNADVMDMTRRNEEFMFGRLFSYGYRSPLRVSPGAAGTYGSILSLSADATTLGVVIDGKLAKAGIRIGDYNAVPCNGPMPANRAAFTFTANGGGSHVYVGSMVSFGTAAAGVAGQSGPAERPFRFLEGCANATVTVSELRLFDYTAPVGDFVSLGVGATGNRVDILIGADQDGTTLAGLSRVQPRLFTEPFSGPLGAAWRYALTDSTIGAVQSGRFRFMAGKDNSEPRIQSTGMSLLDGYVEGKLTLGGVLYARYLDNSNFYRVVWETGGTISLQRRVAGATTTVKTLAGGTATGTQRTVRLSLSGANLTLTVDGASTSVYADPAPLGEGPFGFGLVATNAVSGADASVDDLAVYNASENARLLNLPADHTARWEPVTEDGSATRLRVTTPDGVDRVAMVGYGEVWQFSRSGVFTGATRATAERTLSTLQRRLVRLTTSVVTDTFDRADGGPGAAYTYAIGSAGIAGIVSNRFAHLGGQTAFVQVATAAAITDGYVQGLLTPGAALLWRYADNNNHYRLIWQLDTKLLLQKRVAGTYTTLADYGLRAESSLLLRIAGQGGNLTVSIAGTAQAAVADAALTTGKMGWILMDRSATPAATPSVDSFETFDAQAPTTINVPNDHGALLSQPAVYRVSGSASGYRLGIVDAGGIERAAAQISKGESWKYMAETFTAMTTITLGVT